MGPLAYGRAAVTSVRFVGIAIDNTKSGENVETGIIVSF
jgi:hypothetical protein